MALSKPLQLIESLGKLKRKQRETPQCKSAIGSMSPEFALITVVHDAMFFNN